jgi:hypothetical protein
VLFNESGTQEGYCTAECSQTVACPASPAGAQCAFQLQSGKTVCGFLCSATNTTCPTGLNCNYNQKGDFYYCTTDAPAKCGNNVIEFTEECDGTQTNNVTCQMLGYSTGTITCNNCKLDKSGCSGGSSGSIPAKDCTAGDAACKKVAGFSPTQGDGYNVTHEAKYSYLREDTTMLVKYGTASVKYLMPGSWPLGLGDMSEASGATPGTDVGVLRHPQGTHVSGADIDIAYYQTGQQNNNLRPVCNHESGGKDQYHCVDTPNILDGPRSALLLGKFLESDRVRVIGVDGKIGPILQAEAQTLHSQGLITTTALNKFSSKIAFEATNTGMGWYQFHHHHLHLSTWTTAYSLEPGGGPFGPAWEDQFHRQPAFSLCIDLSCDKAAISTFFGQYVQVPVRTLKTVKQLTRAN